MQDQNARRRYSNRAMLAAARAAGAVYRNPDRVVAAAQAAGAAAAANAVQKIFGSNKSNRLRTARQASTKSLEGPVISAPVTKGYGTLTSAPRITSNGRSYMVKHRELVNGNILGSTQFSKKVEFVVNPGVAASFPWASAIANQYEQWKGKVTFSYIPIAPTSARGDIIMCADYNVYDPPPLTETQAIDHVGCVTAPVWTASRIVLDAKAMFPTGARKYIRNGNVSGDKRLYDGAKFYLFSNNCADALAIGKLMVEYELEFFVPQLESPTAILSNLSSFVGPGNQTFSSAVKTVFNPGFVSVGDALSIGNPTGDGRFSLPPGCYNIRFKTSLSMQTDTATFAVITFSIDGVESDNQSRAVATTGNGNGAGFLIYHEQTIIVTTGAYFQINITMVGSSTMFYVSDSANLTFSNA